MTTCYVVGSEQAYMCCSGTFRAEAQNIMTARYFNQIKLQFEAISGGPQFMSAGYTLYNACAFSLCGLQCGGAALRSDQSMPSRVVIVRVSSTSNPPSEVFRSSRARQWSSYNLSIPNIYHTPALKTALSGAFFVWLTPRRPSYLQSQFHIQCVPHSCGGYRKSLKW